MTDRDPVVELAAAWKERALKAEKERDRAQEHRERNLDCADAHAAEIVRLEAALSASRAREQALREALEKCLPSVRDEATQAHNRGEAGVERALLGIIVEARAALSEQKLTSPQSEDNGLSITPVAQNNPNGR